MASTINASTSAGLVSTADTSGVLQLQTAGTAAVTVDASQNLGLGVTPSAWGTSYKAIEGFGGGAFAFNLGSSVPTIVANAYNSVSGWTYKTSAVSAMYQLNGGTHQWYNAPSGTAGNAITFTQAMTLDASGRLGVGQTSPSAKLDILSTSGTTAIFKDSARYALVSIQSSGTNQDTYLDFTPTGTGSAVFQVSSIERARIDSSGNLVVGNTSASNVGATGGFTSVPNSGASYNLIGHTSGTASGSVYEYFYYNSNNIGSITQSGTTAVLYNVTSDQRLKENIVDAPEFGSVIDSLQVRSFDWKTDQTHQRAGFVAQELVSVAPEAVHQPADPDEMMAVDYSKLVPMLVKEIQSLRIRIAQLEAK
jgi:hypothetical protein